MADDALQLTPYSTTSGLAGLPPSWIPDALDAQRVQSYALYDAIFQGLFEFYEPTLRGSNDAPVYAPVGKIIIDAVNRYVAPGFTVDVASASDSASDGPDVVAARTALRNLLARERFASKFLANKRDGLKRGDMVWHVTVDEDKPAGSRIRITPVDPGSLFLIFDEDDVDRVIGCHLVEQIVTAKGSRVRRQTYRKYIDDETVTVTYEQAVFELDQWGDPEGVAEKIEVPEYDLPPEITALPVYHWRNGEEVGNPYGSSELRGLERIMVALNQALSDQDLTLAMAGLGQWVYRGPQPTDDGTPTGNPVGFRFGPATVVNLPEDADIEDLKHVAGPSSVAPYADHITRLYNLMMAAAAVPDIAVGEVSAAAAESGVARMLKFAPLLAKCDEKNVSLIDLHRQMFHDILNGWMPAYEGLAFEDVTAECSVGSALPIDRSEILAELKQFLADGVIDTGYYRERLRELGYVFPDDIAERIQAEQDRFAARSAAELDAPGSGDG